MKRARPRGQTLTTGQAAQRKGKRAETQDELLFTSHAQEVLTSLPNCTSQGKEETGVITAVSASHQSSPHTFCDGRAVCTSNFREGECTVCAHTLQLCLTGFHTFHRLSRSLAQALLGFPRCSDVLGCLTWNQSWETCRTSHSNIDKIRFEQHHGSQNGPRLLTRLKQNS